MYHWTLSVACHLIDSSGLFKNFLVFFIIIHKPSIQPPPTNQYTHTNDYTNPDKKKIKIASKKVLYGDLFINLKLFDF